MWLTILYNILIFFFGYLIGSINSAIIYSRHTSKGDIRKLGSGNAGSANIARNFSKAKAKLIFYIDIFKIVVPCLIIWSIKWTTYEALFVQVVALGVFIGHIYPIFHRFKGGKGVAIFFGFLVLYNILLFIIAYILLYVIYKRYKLISLGSVIIPTIMFGLSWIPWIDHGHLSFFLLLKKELFWVNPICILVMNIIILLKHISNIKRIAAGNERGIDNQNKI